MRPAAAAAARLHIQPASFSFTLLLGVLAALPALSIDISAPTLLLLPAALDTTTFVAGLTLSLFMVGFAAGQLAGGRLSDRIGRRPVLLTALIAFSAAGLACASSPSAPALVTFRLLQGFGAGACSVLAFAMIQDAFEGEAARSKRSYVTVVFGLIPLLAPALGVVLMNVAGWRSVHSVLAIAGGLLLAVCWLGVAETRGTIHRPPSTERPVASTPRWFERRFIGIAIANALSYGCIFSYIAGSPVVIMGQWGLPSAVYAAVFASTAASLSAGAWTSGRLGRRGIDAASMLNPSLAVSAAAALVLGMVCCVARSMPAALCLPPLLVVLFARGMIGPNLQHLGMQRKREWAGTASAVIGVMQLSAGAIASGVVAALLPHLGPVGVGGPMAVLSVAALVAWWWAMLPE